MIIGLTGSFGAGKGEVSKFLIEQKGFQHLSIRRVITEEVEKRNLPVNRDNMAKVGNDMRAKGGPAFLYEQIIAKADELGGDVVAESIRTVAEAQYTKEQGGIVIGVDADPELRYQRAVQRGSDTDHVSFAEWKAQEEAESNPDDPNKQDIFGALKQSDVVLQNDGTLEELHQQIEVVLSEVL